ncbi:MAG: hypothetical protein GC206_14320 [Alphaproteobacteria bacterium]|nr:hypothetical protein [Alphaproteobacteria bacterium]
MRKRSLAAALTALAMAACTHAPAPQADPGGGQPKRLAWAEGCWRSADAQTSFGLLPDRARAGVHSGLILETIEGEERATRRMLLSTDGQMLSFGAPQDREDAFWRSPYDAPPPRMIMRRVNLTDAERADLVSMPRYAAFADAYGGRLLLVGDGGTLGILWVHPSGAPGETYFSGARTACRDGGLASESDV